MPATDEDLYSIVVSGKMNPSIHHPAWYRATDLLTPDETEVAYRDAMTTAMLSKFSTNQLEIVCDQDLWQATTRSEQHVERIERLARETFRILYHTPVSAFGINCAFHRATIVPHVGRFLADLAMRLGLYSEVRDDEEGSSAALKHTRGRADGAQMNVTIDASIKSSSSIFVYVNMHHQIIMAQGVPFDLSPLIEASMQADIARAKEQLSCALACLSRNS